MVKPLLSIALTFFICVNAFAQKKKAGNRDSVAFYMSDKTHMAYSQVTAQFLRLIVKADSGMFEVQDYYPDGTPRLLAKSLKQEMDFERNAHGPYIEYFLNGVKRFVRKYNRGKLIGDDTTYYSNGKLYNVVNHGASGDYLKLCIDTNGKILADNGNGTWIKRRNEYSFDETITGQVINGKEDGIWLQRYPGDSLIYKTEYKNGVEQPGADHRAERQIFTAVEQQPSFGNDENGFNRYVSYAIRYPQYAREHRITGRVIITFVVEKTGKLSEFKVLTSPDESLSREALRVMQNCPPWKPGIQNGKPVRVQFSVPVSFQL